MSADETPLHKLNDELREAHVDPTLTVEHDITRKIRSRSWWIR